MYIIKVVALEKTVIVMVEGIAVEVALLVFVISGNENINNISITSNISSSRGRDTSNGSDTIINGSNTGNVSVVVVSVAVIVIPLKVIAMATVMAIGFSISICY